MHCLESVHHHVVSLTDLRENRSPGFSILQPRLPQNVVPRAVPHPSVALQSNREELTQLPHPQIIINSIPLIIRLSYPPFPSIQMANLVGPSAIPFRLHQFPILPTNASSRIDVLPGCDTRHVGCSLQPHRQLNGVIYFIWRDAC